MISSLDFDVKHLNSNSCIKTVFVVVDSCVILFVVNTCSLKKCVR